MSDPTPTASAPAASTPASAPAAAPVAAAPAAAPASTTSAPAPVTTAAPAAAAPVVPADTKQQSSAKDGAEKSLLEAAKKDGEAKKVEESKQSEDASLLKAQSSDKKDESKKDESPKTDQAKATAEIEVKVPEGVVADPAVVDELKTLAKARGWDSETAQQVFDLGVKAATAQQEQFVTALQKDVKAHQEQCISQLRQDWKAPGEFDKNIQAAQRVIDKCADPSNPPSAEELKLLDGAPGLMRMLAKVGKALGEDTVALPGLRSAVPPAKQKVLTGDAMADALANDPTFYPSMQPKEKD